MRTAAVFMGTVSLFSSLGFCASKAIGISTEFYVKLSARISTGGTFSDLMRRFSVNGCASSSAFDETVVEKEPADR